MRLWTYRGATPALRVLIGLSLLRDGIFVCVNIHLCEPNNWGRLFRIGAMNIASLRTERLSADLKGRSDLDEACEPILPMVLGAPPFRLMHYFAALDVPTQGGACVVAHLNDDARYTLAHCYLFAEAPWSAAEWAEALRFVELLQAQPGRYLAYLFCNI